MSENAKDESSSNSTDGNSSGRNDAKAVGEPLKPEESLRANSSSSSQSIVIGQHSSSSTPASGHSQLVAQAAQVPTPTVMHMVPPQQAVVQDGQHFAVTSQGMVLSALPHHNLNVMRGGQGLQLISQQQYGLQQPYFNTQLMLTPVNGQQFAIQQRNIASTQAGKLSNQLLNTVSSTSSTNSVAKVTLSSSLIPSAEQINSINDTSSTNAVTSANSPTKPSVATVMPQMKQQLFQPSSQKSVVIAVPTAGATQPFVVANKTPQHFGQFIRLANGQQVIINQAGITNPTIFQQVPIQPNAQFIAATTTQPASGPVIIRTNSNVQPIQPPKKDSTTTKLLARKPGSPATTLARGRVKPKALSKATAAQRNAALMAGVISPPENPLVSAKNTVPIHTTLSSAVVAPGSQSSTIQPQSAIEKDNMTIDQPIISKPQKAVSPMKIEERGEPESKSSSEEEILNNKDAKSSSVELPTFHDKRTGKKTAIVRPDVLVHVIDGMVICESKEPLDDGFDLAGLTNTELPTSDKEEVSSDLLKARESEDVGSESGNQAGSGETPKCEICGKVDKASRFKRSKRFCSISCAKRYNVWCSKRIGQIEPIKIEQDGSVKVEDSKQRKKKTYLKRKWKRSQNGGRLDGSPLKRDASNKFPVSSTSEDSDNDKMNLRKVQTKNVTANESSSDSEDELPRSITTSFSATNSPGPLSPGATSVDEVPPPPSGHPDTWTVNDVYAFVKSIIGCQTYADCFRQEQIDGQALLLLKHEHLMSTMNMKLGPALKLSDLIKKISE
ncbi:DgyrCDS1140 [Dimorphilus gyrociliatus]|uniref:DgyrCDS1140 n=1 Tax=Dimorphilus gyrociliatus TaxID=2664684 RepID=A0A7I8V9I4_9ANNE|nr:DgyrCDS1140 [Dimorphilus gyrociliatus]